MTSPRTLLVAGLAFGLAVSAGARADIYTWTAPDGNLNISNVPPPEGVRVTKVIRTVRPSAPSDAGDDAGRVQALSERVQQLEDALQAAAHPPPSPPPPVAPPTVVQYVPVPIAVPAPAPVEYVVREPAAPACDPGWAGCWPWGSWGWPFYPSSIVVTTVPTRHYRNADRRHPMPHGFKSVAPFGIVRPLVR